MAVEGRCVSGSGRAGSGWARCERLRSLGKRLVWKPVGIALVWGLAAGYGFGQSAVDGAIAGRVVDARGMAVAGAKVAAVNTATGLATVVASGQDGRYLAVRMVPGEYAVTITAAGFGALVEAATVGLEEVSTVDARLVPGGASTTVEVEAASSLRGAGAANAGPVSLGRAVPDDELDGLPNDGSRWLGDALTTPGVGAGALSGGAGALSFRGLATTQNSSTIDGVSNDQAFSGAPVGTGADSGREAEEEADSGGESGVGGDGARAMSGRHAGAAYTFSQAAVREFQVRAQGYSALDGHAAGGVVTTVSRGGTSAVRGTVFYRVRDSAWAATNPFSIATTYQDGAMTSGLVKPEDLRQQFGGTLGGPVRVGRLLRQRKLFYFFTTDEQRRTFPAVSSPEYAQFYQLTATQEALLGTRGVSMAQTNAALNYLDSLTGTVARQADQGINFGKLDWQATARNHLSFEDNRVRWDSPAGGQGGAVVNRGLASLGNGFGKVDAGVARWVGFWSSHLSNEARVAYGRDFEYETAQTPLPQEPAIGPGGYAPEVSIAPNGFTFGTPASLGRLAYPDEHRLQVAEMVAWVHRRHLVQIGFDFSKVQEYIDALSNQEGTFHYDSGVTPGFAGGLVDWITDYTFNVHAYPNGGCPSIFATVHEFCFRSFTQSFGEQAVRFNTQEWAGFVQDSWRVRAGLNVSAGLRYEYELEPLPQQPNPALDALFGARGATSVIPEDRNNVGPRVGLAWEPGGKGKGMVRVGYGVYYGRIPGATLRAALLDTALPESTTHVRITPATVTGCPQVANEAFGYVCSYLTTPPEAVGTTTTATVFDHRFRVPMVQQGSFALEREFGWGTTVSASYVLNLDRQLPNSVDINIAPSANQEVFQLRGGPVNGTGPLGVTNGETFVVPVYSQRISTDYGPVTDVVSNANGTYNGLVLEGRKRSRRGLEFRANWTWAKALDYGQDTGSTPRTNAQFDPFTLGYDKGLSTLNLAHKVTALAVWQPTFVRAKRWERSAANGWAVAPLFKAQSGRPYSYEIFGGTRLSGGHESINGSGGAAYLPTIGRNTLRLPETVNLDLRVSRSLRLSEKMRLHGEADVFNVMNRVNYTSITTRAYLVGTTENSAPVANGVTTLLFQSAAQVAMEGLNVQPFGTYTAASSSLMGERKIQLGLRLAF